MTPKEKAKELVDKFGSNYPIICKIDSRNMYMSESKHCALIAVDYIITSNPHSNPFNTDVHSTMAYWLEVKQEIEKL